MHFLPGAPLTASSGALIFVPQTGFAEICFSNYIIFSQQEEGGHFFRKNKFATAP